jgi:hypothetical protein
VAYFGGRAIGKVGVEVLENEVEKELPLQWYHFATNKNKIFTPQMESIA